MKSKASSNKRNCLTGWMRVYHCVRCGRVVKLPYRIKRRPCCKDCFMYLLSCREYIIYTSKGQRYEGEHCADCKDRFLCATTHESKTYKELNSFVKLAKDVIVTCRRKI